MKPLALAASAIFVAAGLMPGCSSSELPVGYESTSVADGGDAGLLGAPGLDVDGGSSYTTGDVIATLSDAQANALCAWLAQEFRLADPSPPDPNATTDCGAGYACGPGMGCQMYLSDDASNRYLLWDLLSQENCVLNLRATRCTATIGQLATCIQGSIEYHTTNEEEPDGAIVDHCGACSDYEDNPSCTQTVFQAAYYGLFGNGQPPCVGGVPIVAGATCNYDAGVN